MNQVTLKSKKLTWIGIIVVFIFDFIRFQGSGSWNICIIIRHNTLDENTWTFDIIRVGSGNFQNGFNHTNGRDYLFVDVEVGQGEPTLVIYQGDQTENAQVRKNAEHTKGIF